MGLLKRAASAVKRVASGSSKEPEKTPREQHLERIEAYKDRIRNR